ncbi:DUF2894 domain-containing protein [Hydrogenophaga sp.]|uniref:DUF2894 domain-containing protein n=1 Tax=Hydrogenophaga sp. TaxID=1904254 RepID=UPI0025BF3F12|nr:DUF2894 domain-containing protein [Hydrogenophaga sp.]
MKPQAPQPAASPLATLNAHIAQAARAASEAAEEGANATGGGVGVGLSHGPWPELRSAQRFRQTWERLGAEVQVQQAQARAPSNAGPLNPQRLMIDTLARMGELSPHYLRRFLAHAQTLLWLEQVQGQLKVPAGKGKLTSAAKGMRQKT